MDNVQNSGKDQQQGGGCVKFCYNCVKIHTGKREETGSGNQKHVYVSPG